MGADTKTLSMVLAELIAWWF